MTETPPSDSSHYSYAHYANRAVAEGFDDLRFGGPIGHLLAEAQAALLRAVLAPLAGRTVADVGTGTGRAALALAQAGARVVGLDASAEMIDVARSKAAQAGLDVRFEVADAHQLPLADRSVDAAVCFRVLMHAVDWRRALGELCRVAGETVVVDFPSATSFAALESAWRRRQARRGRPVEAYRVFHLRDVEAALSTHGFRIKRVERQFVLPIHVHKRLGRPGVSRTAERALARLGLLTRLGSPVTVVAER